MPLVHPHPLHDAVRRWARAATLAIPAMLAVGTGSARQAVAQDTFIGTVVYETSAEGPDADRAAMFAALGSRRETVTWGSGGNMRLETEGGMYAGVVVVRLADSAIYTLDADARVARGAWMHSLNLEDATAAVLTFMQEQLAPPEVERTDEEGSFAGHRCRMYRVVHSGMMSRGATGRACIAEDIHARPSRYNFDWTDSQGLMATLPLQFGFREGLPLMLEVNEDGAIVTYRAVVLTPGEPDDALFSVPADYTVIPRGPAD